MPQYIKPPATATGDAIVRLRQWPVLWSERTSFDCAKV